MLKTPTGTELVVGARVSDGFFRTLGVAPAIGRDFHAGEDRPEAPPTVILSHAAWQKRFGGRADVIGQSVTLNGDSSRHRRRPPPGLSIRAREARPSSGRRCARPTAAICAGAATTSEGSARLADGVSIETARADDGRRSRKQLETQYPDTNRDQGASVMSLSDVIVGDIRPVLLVLLGGAGLLLLIACVNVASLVLVRSESRGRELAVRSALGASKGTPDSSVPHRRSRARGSRQRARRWPCLSGSCRCLLGLIPCADDGVDAVSRRCSASTLRVGACAAAIALCATHRLLARAALRLSGSEHAARDGRRRAGLLGEHLAPARVQARGAGAGDGDGAAGRRRVAWQEPVPPA